MYSILNDWHCNCQRLKSVAFANLFENSIYIFIFGSLCHAELPRRSSVRLRVYVLVAYRKAKVYSKCSWKNVKSTVKKWSKLFKSVFKVSLVTRGRVSGKILTGCDVGWCEKVRKKWTEVEASFATVWFRILNACRFAVLSRMPCASSLHMLSSKQVYNLLRRRPVDALPSAVRRPRHYCPA